MSRNFIPDLHGRAALVRIDHGDELTWDKVAERIAGFGKNMTKPELELVIGYLAASILTKNSPDLGRHQPKIGILGDTIVGCACMPGLDWFHYANSHGGPGWLAYADHIAAVGGRHG